MAERNQDGNKNHQMHQTYQNRRHDKQERNTRTYTTITDRIIIQIWRQDQEDVGHVEKKVTYEQNAQMSNVTTAKIGDISNINAMMHSQKDDNSSLGRYI